MIWIYLGLSVLCIALSCVALRYRREMDKVRDKLANCIEKNDELRDSRDWHRNECDRLLSSIGNLNIEVDATKERLKLSEFQCDLLRKKSDDKSKRIESLLVENSKLRSQLPKRDSKGRYCKK